MTNALCPHCHNKIKLEAVRPKYGALNFAKDALVGVDETEERHILGIAPLRSPAGHEYDLDGGLVVTGVFGATGFILGLYPVALAGASFNVALLCGGACAIAGFAFANAWQFGVFDYATPQQIEEETDPQEERWPIRKKNAGGFSLIDLPDKVSMSEFTRVAQACLDNEDNISEAKIARELKATSQPHYKKIVHWCKERKLMKDKHPGSKNSPPELTSAGRGVFRRFAEAHHPTGSA